ncbi:MAG TPA: CBS domain-containing protein [Gammaproteobacteria bacterium]
MKRIPPVKRVMTPFPYSIAIDAPVSEALEFMRRAKIRHLPVVENDVLKGIVSDRDIKLLLGPDFAYPRAEELSVREAMAADAYIVDLSTPLDAVLDHMATHRLGSALVTRKGKLAGVFTATDACRAFADMLVREFGAADSSDAA